MQLVVEPESGLDLEINMSGENDQNIKSNDLKNVDIDDLGHKKCNGKDRPSDLKEKFKNNGENGFISETVEKVVDMPINIDNSEAEMSNVDLSDIINENSDILEVDNLPIEESQNQSLENGVNGSLPGENGIVDIDDSKDSIEDDYLEDDIISIVAEPCKVVSLPEMLVENEGLEKSDVISYNSIAVEEDEQEGVNKAEEHLHLDKTSTIDTDDVVEVIEDTENLPIQIENIDEDHITEEQGLSEQDKVEEKVTSQNQDDLSIKENEKIADTLIPASIGDLDNIEIIDKPDSDHEKKDHSESLETTTHDKNTGVTKIENNSNTCDNSKEGSKQGEVEVTEETEKTTPSAKTDGNDNEDSMQSIEEKDSEMKEATDEIEQISITLDSPATKTHDVEIIDDSDEPCERDQNSTNVPIGEEKENDNVQNINIETTSNNETELQDSKDTPGDEPEVLSENNMVVEEQAKAAAVAVDSQLAMDVDDENRNGKSNDEHVPSTSPAASVKIDKPVICKLSNNLDILSDDEDLPEINFDKPSSPKDNANNKCIDLEDDDVMVVDEYTKTSETEKVAENAINEEEKVSVHTNTDSETGEKTTHESSEAMESQDKQETTPPPVDASDLKNDIDLNEKTTPEPVATSQSPPPLITDNFVSTAKKKLADMTRDELEEFCILKIVESIIDRSSLSDIKNKLKTMAQGLEEYRKKSLTLTKQNRDLQVVLKSVEEEQKKASKLGPITPLKITRSVGMQVYMEKTGPRKKGPQQNVNNKTPNNTPSKAVPPLNQAVRPQKQVTQNIPVPRLVPANSPASKATGTMPQVNQTNTPPNKNINPTNGLIKTPPTAVKAEKRQHNKISSVTVDLTDDEPPTKIPGAVRTSPGPPVRLVSPQNLMAPQRPPFPGANLNNPRKVYIPISGPQNQALRPGQTIMLKAVPASGIRPRCPTPQVTRVDPNSVRMGRIPARHPAPLPVAMKQYQPPNWKSLPPAPDLKLSKVENGIVISWKIEGVPEDSYEEIASYQLYAYQETSQPPSTSLWKKIGDVKALPLPMACTLTQFMAGFKYYFAVRAVDIRSRLGAFSLPGSILLLSKNI